MEGPQVLDIARDAVWVAIMVGAPIMLTGLVVGVIVSLLQAVTQLQEMTLSYIPKILAIFASLLIFLPFMGAQMSSFMDRIAAAIIEAH